MAQIPQLDDRGLLPPGIYETSLANALERFAWVGDKRQKLGQLLTRVVQAAQQYPTIKRVLVWGSFVSAKTVQNDPDYSLVVSVNHGDTTIDKEHRRFLVPYDARLFYEVDRGYLIIPDYPIETYANCLMFLCDTREQGPRGIIEIPLREGIPW